MRSYPINQTINSLDLSSAINGLAQQGLMPPSTQASADASNMNAADLSSSSTSLTDVLNAVRTSSGIGALPAAELVNLTEYELFGNSGNPSPSDSNTSSSNTTSDYGVGGARRSLMLISPQVLAEIHPYQANDPMIRNGSQWFHSRVQNNYAWLVTTGASEVVVAIIDTGADLSHPDLAGSLWVNAGEIPDNGIDDDNNGFIDDVHGWDFAGACVQRDSFGHCLSCGSRATPIDTDGHGTHVAGIVAATQNNQEGGSGSAPGVKIMILRVSDCLDGSIYAGAVAQAYNYALQNGAQIAQCSFGMSYPQGFSPTSPAPWYNAGWNQAYISAIQPLQQNGVMVVAAAGNEGIDMDVLANLGYSYNPCLVNLSNVICVAATDPFDNLTFFSNYGKNTVQLGAPGLQIVSTMLNSTYLSLTGTSMAAPMVSGIAALALSVLGASSGNFHQAQAIKSILNSSVDLVSGVPVMFGGRANGFSAVQNSWVQAYMQAQGLVNLQPSILLSAQLPLTVQGFTETYISTSSGTPLGTPLSQISNTMVLDSSVRSGQPRFSYFKYSSRGMAVIFSSFLQFNNSGVYNVKIQAQPSSLASSYSLSGGTVLYVSGTLVPISSSGSGSFQVLAPGFYSLELQIPMPQTSVVMYLRQPYSAVFSIPSMAFTIPYQALTMGGAVAGGLGPATSSSSFQPSGLQLVNGWQLMYNVSSNLSSSTSSEVMSMTSAAARQGSSFQYMTLLPDLSYETAPSLSQGLLTGAAAANVGRVSVSSVGVVGLASTTLHIQPIAKSFVLSVTCNRCVVWLEGLMVIDSWQGLALGSASAVTQSSGCITLPARAGPAVLAVAFATANFSAAQLQLQWSPLGSCKGYTTSSTSSSSFSYLSGQISTSTTWLPLSNTAGQVSGLQCDAWRSGTLPAVSQYQALPLGAVAPGSPDFKKRLDSGQWSMTLESLFPGLASRFPPSARPNQPFSLRCWAYAPTSIAPSLLQMHVPMPAVGQTSRPSGRMLLAGRQVWPLTAGSQGTSQQAAVQFTGPAPPTWALYMLLVAEWENLTPSLMVSMSTSLGGPLNLQSLKLPLLVRGVMPSFSLSTSVSGVGPPGHLSRTCLPPNTLEVAALQQYDQSTLALVGSFASPAFGLCGQFSYNVSLQGLVRYTQAGGYLAAVAPGPQNYTLRVVDDYATSTSLVVAPGVSLVNARPFSLNSNPAAQISDQFVLPSGYLFMEAIIKTARADGETPIDVAIASPVQAAGPVDVTVWYRPITSLQTTF
ncbi:hypothetical protein CEUSTIGMA_g10833.t1 [Chlamydomonas eustigma]|uniref:Peptidase S8/S53 domain-containing protein n=1 Tax=Chlamydomonas eustigma TaxID=1157962 RepID=A0A250XK13_9CHLO|nr:hypothetical protein CEUSTIGMA_g10833.t1 [Chlamydomonas eustigma]|eukprot:GAX83408.1 hypothetical protein CEUSTIGMA_g10833.t1 [Chlamydomonas eustigma]